jgi:hypothetical protein
MLHASCFMLHASCFMLHASCSTIHTPYSLPPLIVQRDEWTDRYMCICAYVHMCICAYALMHWALFRQTFSLILKSLFSCRLSEETHLQISPKHESHDVDRYENGVEELDKHKTRNSF